MFHLSDKDLDRLSKDAAEQYDVGQNASGWDQLEKKLDRELPLDSRNLRRKIFFFLSLAVLLTGAGLTWMLMQTPRTVAYSNLSGSTTQNPASADKNIPAQQSERPDQSGQDDVTVPPLDEHTAQTKQADKTQLTTEYADAEPSGNETRNAKSDLVNKNVRDSKKRAKNGGLNGNGSTASTRPPRNKINKTLDAKISSRSKPQRVDKTSRASNSNVSVGRKKQSQSPPTQTRDANTAANTKKQPEAASSKTTDASASSATKKQSQSPPIQTRDANIPANTKQQPTNPNANTLDSNLSAKKQAGNLDIKSAGRNVTSTTLRKASGNFQRKIEIGILASPDVSKVRSQTSNNIGLNFGLQAGYRFSDRLSVNVGAIYSKKNYFVKGKDFYPPEHYWTYYVDLKQVKGSCWMLDIPLNVRYDISTNNKNRLFISSGISSYVMDRESYKYYYSRNNIDSIRGATYRTNHNYWLSSINISGGLEHAVSDRFSLQLEPYYKIPTKGIGFGKIDLSSYGLFVSLKYKPSVLTRKSKP